MTKAHEELLTDAYINAHIVCPGCENPFSQVLNSDAGETIRAPLLRCDTTRCPNKGKLFKSPTLKLEPVENQ